MKRSGVRNLRIDWQISLRSFLTLRNDGVIFFLQYIKLRGTIFSSTFCKRDHEKNCVVHIRCVNGLNIL